MITGQKNESCYKNDQCQYPLKCLDEICDCPPNTRYSTTIGRLGMKSVSRYIPNSGKVSFANPDMP